MQCPMRLPKKPLWEPGASARLAPYPGLGSSGGKLIFYLFRGRRGVRRPRFSPAGRGRGESREAMARLGLRSVDTCCCSQHFGLAQTALLLSRLGLRPAAPCPGARKGGGEVCGREAAGVSPQGCPSVLLEVISVLSPCTNCAFLPLGMGQSPPAPTRIAPHLQPQLFWAACGWRCKYKTQEVPSQPPSQTKGSKIHFPRYSDGAEVMI